MIILWHPVVLFCQHNTDPELLDNSYFTCELLLLLPIMFFKLWTLWCPIIAMLTLTALFHTQLSTTDGTMSYSHTAHMHKVQHCFFLLHTVFTWVHMLVNIKNFRLRKLKSRKIWKQFTSCSQLKICQSKHIQMRLLTIILTIKNSLYPEYE